MKSSFKSLLGFLLFIALFSSCERPEIDEPVTDETGTYAAGSFSMKINGELWEADSATVSVREQTPLDKRQDTMLFIRISADKAIDGGNENFIITRIVSKEEFKAPTGEINLSSTSTLAYFSRIVIVGENAYGYEWGSLVLEVFGRGKVIFDKFKIGGIESVREGKVVDLQGYTMLHGTFEMKMYQRQEVQVIYPDLSEADPGLKFLITEGKFNATGVSAY